MWKMETNAGTLDALRRAIAKTSPEMIDLGLRIASAKATAMDHGMAGGFWDEYVCALYLTDAEYDLVNRVAGEQNIDLADHGGFRRESGVWKRNGTRFSQKTMRTDFSN